MLPPPPAPDQETAARWKQQATTYALIIEDYGRPNDVVQAWLEQHLGEAALMVGPPDVSANSLRRRLLSLRTSWR